MISVEEANRRQYDRDIEQHDCGYWSVCDDHACGCAISDNVDGFDNSVYMKMKTELWVQVEEETNEYYDMDDHYADENFYDDEDNSFNDYIDDYYENYCKPYDK